MQCNLSNYFLYNEPTKVDSVNVSTHLLGFCGFILSYIVHNWDRKKLFTPTCPLPQHVVCDNHVTLWAG